MRILHRIRHAIAWAVMPDYMRVPYVLGSSLITSMDRYVNETKKEEKSDD